MSEGNGQPYRDAVIVERFGVGQVVRESDGFKGIEVRFFWSEGELTGLMTPEDAKRLRVAIDQMLGESFRS